MTTPAALVRRFYADVWNRADEAAAREILTDDLRFRGSLGPEKVGCAGFVGYMRSVHRALADYTCTIDDLITSGDRAAARMTFRGRHQGVFFGVPATGREIVWAGAAFFRIDGAKIAEVWVLGDIDAMKAQLGAPAAAPFG